jgi:hypothetical protein
MLQNSSFFLEDFCNFHENKFISKARTPNIKDSVDKLIYHIPFIPVFRDSCWDLTVDVLGVKLTDLPPLDPLKKIKKIRL